MAADDRPRTLRQVTGEYAASPRVRLGRENEYEVLLHDGDREGRLVAAVEIVSPENKEDPECRRVFSTRCAALLRQRVSVVIIDLVTVRHFNLYADLLGLIDRSDPSFGSNPVGIYVASCRCIGTSECGRLLETWAYPLNLGRPLPTLPLWLADDLAVPLELEKSYEETCRVLHIA